MLNQDTPKEYVLASGETHTIREFLETCLEMAGIHWEKKGTGDDEKYFDRDTGNLLVYIDPQFYRPAEVLLLCGNPCLAEKELGWVRKTDFKGLVKKMFENDCHPSVLEYLADVAEHAKSRADLVS